MQFKPKSARFAIQSLTLKISGIIVKVAPDSFVWNALWVNGCMRM